VAVSARARHPNLQRHSLPPPGVPLPRPAHGRGPCQHKRQAGPAAPGTPLTCLPAFQPSLLEPPPTAFLLFSSAPELTPFLSPTLHGGPWGSVLWPLLLSLASLFSPSPLSPWGLQILQRAAMSPAVHSVHVVLDSPLLTAPGVGGSGTPLGLPGGTLAPLVVHRNPWGALGASTRYLPGSSSAPRATLSIVHAEVGATLLYSTVL